MLKTKQLELQLCEAKLQQQNIIAQEEMENHLKEKHTVSLRKDSSANSWNTKYYKNVERIQDEKDLAQRIYSRC